MKQTLIYPSLSAILSGLVLAAFGYYVFSTQPTDLGKGVSITYFHADVATEAMQDLIGKVVPSANFKDDEVIRKFKDALGYGNEVNMSFYKIENTSDRAIPNFKAALGTEYFFGYLTNQGSVTPIPNTKHEAEISLLPRSTATLVIVSRFAGFEPEERFVVDGKEVWIESKIDRFRKPLDDAFWFMKDNVFLVGSLAALGVITVFAILMSLLMFFFTRNNADYLVKSTDNWVIVRCLTLLNFIRKDDPGRYAKIVEKSEVQFSKWKPKPPQED